MTFPQKLVSFGTVQSLVGFGVKTVTFLAMRVYVVGLYLPASAKTILVPSENEKVGISPPLSRQPVLLLTIFLLERDCS